MAKDCRRSVGGRYDIQGHHPDNNRTMPSEAEGKECNVCLKITRIIHTSTPSLGFPSIALVRPIPPDLD